MRELNAWEKTLKARSFSGQEIWLAIRYLDPDIEMKEDESAKYPILAFALISWIVFAICLAYIYQP